MVHTEEHMESGPAVPSGSQQLQMPNAFDPQQMHAMMAMAAAGVAGGGGINPGMPSGIGPPPMPPTAMAPGGDISVGGTAPPAFPPGVDPGMAYQMFSQYLQQAQAYACGTDPISNMGAPTAPFPAMGAPPYNPAMPLAPVIAVSVDGMKFQYQLTEDDLLKVFSRYGSVKQIHVDEVGTTAQITFDQFVHAQAAMSDLNGKVLNGLEGTLRLVWATQGPPPIPPYPMMPPFPGWGFPAPGTPAWPGAPPPADLAALAGVAPSLGVPSVGVEEMTAAGGVEGMSAGTANGDSKTPAHVKGVRKYTCRFLIGIENDKEFQVVRRIIGAKGTNMKRIVRLTEAKLRLRGVGSGYFEGAGQKESSEPLQLCVSCTTADGYETAVKLVEELLENVYNEFRQFCKESGRPEPDLRASPQLVSMGPTQKAAGSRGNAALPLSTAQDGTDEGEDGGVDKPASGSRRRGRRSRARKGDAGKSAAVERGDPPSKAPPVDEIERMIDQRNEARRQCNFIEADRVRNSLHERGVALMDEPGARGRGSEVTTWRYWRE